MDLVTKVGINGFGRVGRVAFRQLQKCVDIQVVAVNSVDLTPRDMARLLKLDSVYGVWDCRVDWNDDGISVDGSKIALVNESDPGKIDWVKHGVTHVLECTGKFTCLSDAGLHKEVKVVVSSPSDDIPMYVCGVNEGEYKGGRIVSNASCTTQCTVSLLAELDEYWKIDRAFVTSVHALTNGQSIVDARKGRSCNNIIPCVTGAAQAVAKILPRLEGKLEINAVRVPVSAGSYVQVLVRFEEEVKSMPLIADNTSQFEMVSSDCVGDKRPYVLDVSRCMKLGGGWYRFVCFYDNEWSYCSQMVKLLRHVIEESTALYKKTCNTNKVRNDVYAQSRDYGNGGS